MNRRSPFAQVGALMFLCTALLVVAQTPAPPVPPLTKEQKEAAAAIEAPKTSVSPPLPGQLQGGTPAAPVRPAPSPAPSPATAPDASAGK
ncbi:MAG TPA: hypothetical protein PLB55_14100, partial [Prosthecobacter sp.]|nr:hypothetical protein [Prosthecobacter sp.]